MKVALVQTDIVNFDYNANCERIEALLTEGCRLKPDMVVLPEMFSCGFTPEQQMEKAGDAAFEREMAKVWMGQTAEQQQCVVAGSLSDMDEVSGRLLNRMYVAMPDGRMEKYDKRHLFSMGNESRFYKAGVERLIRKVVDMRVCFLICYDLRFPVFSRNGVMDDGSAEYDCLVYVANWPKARLDAWHALLKARSIENQCYVIGVNRTGVDALTGIAYAGGTVVYGPRGEVVAKAEDAGEQVVEAELDKGQLETFRKKFRVLDDADRFSIVD